jgi:hypothetical protein
MFLMLILTACSNDGYGPVKRSWGKMKGLEHMVGNMSDISYSNVRTMKPRLNAFGEPVAMQDFEGKFVWSEYVAPWCSTSAKQSPETKNVQLDMGGQVAFLTIMTSNKPNDNHHTTVETARSWSNRFKLNADRVLAANLGSKTIPEHRFFSPQGHTLFVHVGYLNADQIRSTITYYKSGWEKWFNTGEAAEWITSN